MKISIRIFTAIIFLIPLISYSQESRMYKHPRLNFQFSAPQKWININHPEDSLIYEMMSPDSILHVMLWYTETEQNVKGYLSKMADMKGLSITEEEPLLKTINDHEIWMYNVPGYAGIIPIQSLLAARSHGKSEIHHKENRLFIIQIWCQKDNYLRNQSRFEEIFNSVQITEE